MSSLSLKLIMQIWLRNFAQFKRAWLVSFFWIILEPLFILLALGFGIGGFVPTIKGTSYIEFFFPGLVCSSAMLISFFSSTYDNFSKLNHQRLFHTQILSQISSSEIFFGEILWAASKGLFSALGVSLIASFFGLVDSFRIFPALMVIFLSGLVFSSLGMLVTTYVKSFDQIIFPTSGFIIPMSLFSGVYFPTDQLPYGLNYLVYLFPLTHATRTVRELILHGYDWWMLGNIFYLALCSYLLIRLARRRLENTLLGI